MTTPLGSHGTLIKAGDAASPEVFTTVAELGDVQPPAFERAMHEALAQDDVYGEVVPGMIKLKAITFNIQWLPDDATHDDTTGLLSLMVAKTLANFQFVFPTSPATTWTISAYVADFTPTAPGDGILTASVTLRPSGAPTF